MDIWYVAHINTRRIRDAVNAVGGAMLTAIVIRGILDPSMDWCAERRNWTGQQRRERCPTVTICNWLTASRNGWRKAMWPSQWVAGANLRPGAIQSLDREKPAIGTYGTGKIKLLPRECLIDFAVTPWWTPWVKLAHKHWHERNPHRTFARDKIIWYSDWVLWRKATYLWLLARRVAQAHRGPAGRGIVLWRHSRLHKAPAQRHYLRKATLLSWMVPAWLEKQRSGQIDRIRNESRSCRNVPGNEK